MNRFLKNTEINFMNIPPVRGGFFHVDGRTNMTKVIVAFRNFADELEIGLKVVKDYYSSCYIIQDLSRLLKFNSPSCTSVVMLESVMNSLLNTDTLLPYRM
jgi:hypothetical protein